jgi:hypothetical protein
MSFNPKDSRIFGALLLGGAGGILANHFGFSTLEGWGFAWFIAIGVFLLAKSN